MSRRHQHVDRDSAATPDADTTPEDKSDTRSNTDSPRPHDDNDRYDNDQFSADDEDDDVKSNHSARRVSSAGSTRRASADEDEAEKRSITSSHHESPAPPMDDHTAGKVVFCGIFSKESCDCWLALSSVYIVIIEVKSINDQSKQSLISQQYGGQCCPKSVKIIN